MNEKKRKFLPRNPFVSVLTWNALDPPFRINWRSHSENLQFYHHFDAVFVIRGFEMRRCENKKKNPPSCSE